MTRFPQLLLAATLALFAAAPAIAQEEEAPRAPVHKKTTKQAKPRKAPKKIPYEKRVDINKASREQILKVKGMTPALVDRILRDRPYKTNAELITRSGFQRKDYDAVRGLIVCGQDLKAPAKPAPKK